MESEIESVLGYQCMDCGIIFPDENTLISHKCTASQDSETIKWGRPMVLALLNIFPKEHAKFLRGQHKTMKKVNDTTAQKLQELGYSHIDGPACDQKWRNLKKVYMANKKKQKQTGTGKIKFEFFTEMDEILGKKPNVSPLATYDSENSQPTYRDDDTVSQDITPDDPTAASSSNTAGKVCSGKKKSVPEWYSKWERKHEEAEDRRRKRHEENLELKKKALALLEKMSEKS